MIALPSLRRPVIDDLFRSVESDLSSYLSSEFKPSDHRFSPFIHDVPNTSFSEDIFDEFLVPRPKTKTQERISNGQADAHNASLLYSSLRGMSPKSARDERIWVPLCLFYGSEFIQKYSFGSSKSQEDQIAKIKTRYFCRNTSRARGFERDNELSRLWWYAHLTSESRLTQLTPNEALEIFLEWTDFREALFGRSSTAIVPKAFEACLLVYKKEKSRDPDVHFFRRSENKREETYGKFFSMVDKFGGRNIYEGFTVNDLTDIFWGFRESVQ